MGDPDPRRALPAVDALAGTAPTEVPAPLARHAARRVLTEARARAGAEGTVADAATLAGRLSELLAIAAPDRPVLNATGILLHTNLGRAPLTAPTDPAWAATSDLELDLATGRRGPRLGGVEAALCALTGAEDALVVNNGAAALTLVLAAVAAGGEVVVSRGQLVEIGGSFRVPEVVTSGGARLHEVGTTNRTHPEDYQRAVGPDTRVLLEVHPSNYVVEGFVARVPTAALAILGHEHGLPVVVDLGSGLLDERCPWLDGPPPSWLGGEPGARQTLRAGADVVTFSGDKLLGGPQAGIICGRADLVSLARRHPLARAVRYDRVRGALLHRTLDAYLRGDAVDEVPFWRLAVAPEDTVQARAVDLAGTLCRCLPTLPPARAVPASGAAGAGAVPGREIPGWAVALDTRSPDALAGALRREGVLAVIADGAVVMHLRTIDPADDATLTAAVCRARSTMS